MSHLYRIRLRSAGSARCAGPLSPAIHAPATPGYWERRSRPVLAIFFPVAPGPREALHWGRRHVPAGHLGQMATARPGGSFGANVDSLHILSDRPWGASLKMLCSLAEAVAAELPHGRRSLRPWRHDGAMGTRSPSALGDRKSLDERRVCERQRAQPVVSYAFAPHKPYGQRRRLYRAHGSAACGTTWKRRGGPGARVGTGPSGPRLHDE